MLPVEGGGFLKKARPHWGGSLAVMARTGFVPGLSLTLLLGEASAGLTMCSIAVFAQAELVALGAQDCCHHRSWRSWPFFKQRKEGGGGFSGLGWFPVDAPPFGPSLACRVKVRPEIQARRC